MPAVRTTFENPRNRRMIIAQSLSVLFFAVLSIISYLVTGKAITAIVPLLLGAVVMAVYASVHKHQYPVKVTLSQNEIEMMFAGGKSRSFSYESIADIYLPPRESNKRYASFRLMGNPYPFHVTLEIAAAIDSSFTVKNGHAIPRWNGRKESKVRGR